MEEPLDTIMNVAAIILGSAVLTFIQFLITRHDKKKELERTKPIEKLEGRLDRFENELRELRRDSDLRDSRTQMLIVMNHFPNDQYQLFGLARHYFVDLKGDWWMSSMFKAHCVDNNIQLPVWFIDDTE